VWLVGQAGSAIALTEDGGLKHPLISVAHGAPHIRIYSMHIRGTVRVHGGHLALSDCSIEVPTTVGEHHVSTAAEERALSIVGGDIALTRTTFSGHSGGALRVDAGGLLTLIECAIMNCHASTGGALLVAGGSRATVISSNMSHNSADRSGGAIQVCPNPSRRSPLLPS
jgi:hypothetical protein